MNNVLFPDGIWNYKNFNMVTELEIAGEFIYDGMSALNKMTVLVEGSVLFSFLYHTSVGIERLQKILIVLMENLDEDNIDDFEKSLITHSHMELNQRICKLSNIKMNTRENSFLQVLSNFYRSARYNRFNYKGQSDDEKSMILEYVKKNISEEKLDKHFITGDLLITTEVKELFGRVIGSLSKKYYNLIYEGCAKNKTFSYEIRIDSKAEKVFHSEHRNDSLYDEICKEAISLKEFLLFLRRIGQDNKLLMYLNNIEPLDYDEGCINYFVDELSKGIISQRLIDETDYLYEMNGYSIERIREINLFGDTNVIFDDE